MTAINTVQINKNCQVFMNKLYQSKHWDTVRSILLRWKEEHKELRAAVDIFREIMHILDKVEGSDDKILEVFNRCFVKDAQLTKKIILDYIGDESGPDPHPSIGKPPNLQSEPSKKQSRSTPVPDKNAQSTPVPLIEEIKDALLLSRIQKHERGRDIIKIISIYLKCVITLPEFKALLSPLYHTDVSLIHYLFQVAEDVSRKRRKVTIFAPLNELIDQKYPVIQVGPSYIIIPEGYANYGSNWSQNPQEYILNRKCVSVPLGSEVSFVIGKKNQFEEQLFNYEDQRYEIDMAMQSLRACERIINRYCSEQGVGECVVGQSKLASPLFQRVINDLYPGQNVYNIFIRHLGLAKQILLPRVIDKRKELEVRREKFMKLCEEVSSKNFKKSLDYRCIYFAKNDRKYNTPSRWEKEIDMRKKQLSEELNKPIQEDIEDRESLTRHRQEYVNTFDHITNQNLMENQAVSLDFDRKLTAQYPAFPDNQILFILNFKDKEILNDVLEIILYNCNRKNLLQLLVFKTMKIDIQKKIRKSPLLLSILETKQRIENNPEVIEMLGQGTGNPHKGYKKDSSEHHSSNHLEETLLNESKSPYNKYFKDEDDYFMEVLKEQEEPACLEDIQSPFEGPSEGYTFIGTKNIYIFMRYLLTIYQRFVKAKEESQQRSSTVVGGTQSKGEMQNQKIDLYKFFLTILIYKIRDKNKSGFEEHLRKLYCEKAFIFFTLQKLIMSAAKIINTITPQSLTHQILKDLTHDYELGLVEWERFPFPTITNQLSRLYKEKQMLYRFTFCKNQGNFFVSAWNPSFKEYFEQQRNNQVEELIESSRKYTLAPTKSRRRKYVVSGGGEEDTKMINEADLVKNEGEDIYKKNENEFMLNQYNGALLMKGQECFVRKNRNPRPLDPSQQFHMQVRKMKKMEVWY